MALANYLVGALVLAAAAIWSAVLTLPDNHLHVVVCDVGQGDGILVWQGTTQMLVDAGPGEKILDCLAKYLPFYDRQIEVALVTHPQLDHFGGLTSVVERYSVLQFVSGGWDSSTQSWRKLKESLQDVPGKTVRGGDIIKLGPKVGFNVIWPTQQYAVGVQGQDIDLNTVAIVGRLTYQDWDMLLTGDADSQIDLAMMATGLLREVEVLKVPHHGSKTGMLDEWLDMISPQMAAISVGKNNSYGHPAQKTLDQLQRVGSQIWRTDLNGDVEFITDGSKWWYNLQYGN